jgi:hypothetical protein
MVFFEFALEGGDDDWAMREWMDGQEEDECLRKLASYDSEEEDNLRRSPCVYSYLPLKSSNSSLMLRIYTTRIYSRVIDKIIIRTFTSKR